MTRTKFNVDELNIISIEQGNNESDFYAQVHCEISEVGKPGGEAILVYVAGVERTPHLFASDSNVLWRPDLLIVKTFDTREIIGTIQRLVDKGRPENWNQLQEQLSPYFSWI